MSGFLAPNCIVVCLPLRGKGKSRRRKRPEPGTRVKHFQCPHTNQKRLIVDQGQIFPCPEPTLC